MLLTVACVAETATTAAAATTACSSKHATEAATSCAAGWKGLLRAACRWLLSNAKLLGVERVL